MSALRWVLDVVGGFAAGFFAYVVCGAFVGAVVTVALMGRGSVCPTDFFGGVGVRCEDPLVRTFWYAVADLPSVVLLAPVGAGLVLLDSPPGRSLLVEGTLLFCAALISGLYVAGFVVWRTRARSVAWALAAAFAFDIAFALWLTSDRVEHSATPSAASAAPTAFGSLP